MPVLDTSSRVEIDLPAQGCRKLSRNKRPGAIVARFRNSEFTAHIQIEHDQCDRHCHRWQEQHLPHAVRHPHEADKGGKKYKMCQISLPSRNSFAIRTRHNKRGKNIRDGIVISRRIHNSAHFPTSFI